MLFLSGQARPLTKQMTIAFQEMDRELPDADSSQTQSRIPIYYQDYNTFSKKFDTVLSYQAVGYGRY